MLLGNKRKQHEEHNWCLVLNPIPNELDKKRVARKISEVFSLSLEEASDLVSNTPIILLDNLQHTTAQEIRDYFRASGAEMVLTNDVFVKRKCYRTVWPEPPNLSFLSQWPKAAPGPAVGTHRPMNPEEALEEIRSLSHESGSGTEARETPPGQGMVLSDSERHHLLEELDRWRKECVTRREEMQRLEEELHQARRERHSEKDTLQGHQAAVQERDAEVRQLRGYVTNMQEKYEALREESRHTRELLEEKAASALRERQREAEKVKEWMTKWESLQQAWRGLEEKSREQERLLAQAREEVQAAGRGAEAEAARFRQELAEWRSKADQGTEKIILLEHAKEELEKALNRQSDDVASWEERYGELQKKYDSVLRAEQAEVSRRDEAEKEAQGLMALRTSLARDLEMRSQEVAELQSKVREFEKDLHTRGREGDEREKKIQEQAAALAERDRDLEQTRRQLREVNLQAEQREAAEKRSQLAGVIAERETQLKKLVKQQERIEAEIRDREQAMREILADQERLEREIIEGKQAQRHLMEQLKKDRSPRVKTTRPDEPAARESAENHATAADPYDRAHSQ